MKNSKNLFALIALVLVSLSQVAFAQEEKEKEKQGPCSTDIQQFCSDITPGKGRIAACLKAHEDKVSAGCRQHEQSMMGEMKNIHQACRADMQKFCTSVKPGEGRVMGCLKQHESELSTLCKTEVDKMKEKVGEMIMGNTTEDN